MKTTGNIFRTLLLAVLTLTFGSCSEDSLLSELGLDGQTTTRTDGVGEVWDGKTVADSFAGGDGTESNPYLIADGAQLARFAAMVNGTLTDGTQQNTAACGKLTADIELNDTKDWETWNESTEGLNPWTPIGSSANQFVGTLDGDGHSVSGIYINNSEAEFQGLVGVLGEGGTLQNLGVKASYIKGGSRVGGLCGRNQGTVNNCYNTGSVAGSDYVSGLCGDNSGTVTNCYNSGSVAGNRSVGGLCGFNMLGTVTNCYNTGSVTGSDYVGGLCGFNWLGGTVTNCYYLTGTANSGIGEGSGEATAKTTDQFASGEVAYRLSTGKNGEIWGQNLTLDPKDSYPVLGGLKVVQNEDGTSYKNELNQEGDFYLISTANELRLFASMVNSGQTSIKGRLTADILLNDISNWESWNESTAPANTWTPIGTNWENPFAGTLDGDGHSVSGIYINNSEADCQGLVGYLGSGGTLQNLGVKASYIKGNSYVGALCGNNSGTVTNCYNTGSVTGTGDYDAGGLCGTNGGTVSNCYNNGSVTGNHYVGGLCGQNYGTMTNCYNTGSVEGNSSVGGLYGSNETGANMSNCYNSGSVTGESGVGGVCGSNFYSNVTNCYNIGSVTGNSSVGGVCGYNSSHSTVGNCYNTGSVEGTGDDVGGVCGYNHYGTVNNCYYLKTCGAAGEGTSKTADEFKSGEVASRLGEGWGQTIGADDSPVLTTDASKKVYALDLYNGTPDKQQSYANIGTSFLPEGSNAIALVDADSPFKTGTNIVVKDGDNSYTCDNLVLTDGADFYTPVKFTATKATYTRSPKVWAVKGSNGIGWETLCLPFSGTLYADDVAKQLILTDLEGDYWLRSLTDFKTPNTLIFASGSTATAADHQIEAGVPYIIALPGTSFGSESLQGKTISVRGTNVKVINTAQSVQPEGSLFAFTGTFATKACDAASYRLNSENGTSGAGDLFVLDTEELAPFRCRIDVIGLNIGGTSRSASGLPKELRIGQ